MSSACENEFIESIDFDFNLQILIESGESDTEQKFYITTDQRWELIYFR